MFMQRDSKGRMVAADALALIEYFRRVYSRARAHNGISQMHAEQERVSAAPEHQLN
jgi:hypothetical protein